MSFKYNFNSLLSRDKELHDVVFITNTEKGELVEEGRIPAHKLPLALVSPVFKAQFFGPLAKPSSGTDNNDNQTSEVARLEEIVIQGHSFAGFKMMIEFIYTGETEAIMSTTDLFLLFDLFSLSDKYFLAPLSELVSEAIVNTQLSLTDYVMVLTVLRKYSDLYNFANICVQLNKHFSKIVLRNLKNPADIFALWENATEEEEELLGQLMKILGYMDKYCLVCDNPKNICKNGEILDLRKCSVGQRVKAVKKLRIKSGFYISEGSLGTITSFVPPQQARARTQTSMRRGRQRVFGTAPASDIENALEGKGSVTITWDNVDHYGAVIFTSIPSEDIVTVCMAKKKK